MLKFFQTDKTDKETQQKLYARDLLMQGHNKKV